MITYEIWDLGRDKWRGEVQARSESVDDVEDALMREARRHLASRGIDFDGDVHSGVFIVGGFREVGRYRKKPLLGVSK